MEYFNIIQALCRSALITSNDAIVHQVTRLISQLEKDGHTKEAQTLSALLSKNRGNVDMAPSRIKSSFVSSGETLTAKTLVPVDKESSTPLAEIFFPDSLPGEKPVFDFQIEKAIESLVQEWIAFEKLIKLGTAPASSCLIYGAPGTGKTHLAMWIAKQLNMPVVLARLEGLMSSFLGTTSRNIGNLFAFAEKYNCVLLLDEFDAIAKLRNDSQEVGEVKRVVNTLLQCLDSRAERGFTIGITNHEALLDPAIWRRFEVQIEIPKPSPEVMLNLLKKFLQPIELKDTELKMLAWSLEGASGADAQTLSKKLKRAYAMEESVGILDFITEFALLNAGRIGSFKRNLMFHGNDAFITSLLEDQTFSFKQKDIAPIFGLTASTLSKHLSKHKDSDKL